MTSVFKRRDFVRSLGLIAAVPSLPFTSLGLFGGPLLPGQTAKSSGPTIAAWPPNFASNHNYTLRAATQGESIRACRSPSMWRRKSWRPRA